MKNIQLVAGFITSWAINRQSVAGCGRTGPTTVDLAEGEHEPSACVNVE